MLSVHARGSAPNRRGFTLVELLTVVSILTLLALLSVPLIGPALRAREAREAARSLSAMLSMAQNRAIELRRPVGILIERSEVEPDAGVAVHLCEVPQPFTGVSDGTKVRVAWDGSDAFTIMGFFTGNGVLEPITGVIRPGDMIRLSGRPDLFVIERSLVNNGPGPKIDANRFLISPDLATPATFWEIRLVGNAVQFPTMPAMGMMGAAMGMDSTFEILRQPVKSTQRPLQFTPGGIIDLGLSGFGSLVDFNAFSVTKSSATSAEAIMFAPDGSLSSIYINGQLQPPLREAVYLLVGKQELTGATAVSTSSELQIDEPAFNYQDPNARWLRIEPNTGQVIVAETVPPAAINQTIPIDGNEVIASRALAKSGEAMGGDR